MEPKACNSTVSWHWNTHTLHHNNAELISLVKMMLNMKQQITIAVWPARSPDLTACDYWLWDYLKERLYSQKPRDVDMLKIATEEEIHAIPINMCHKAMKEFPKHCQCKWWTVWGNKVCRPFFFQGPIGCDFKTTVKIKNILFATFSHTYQLLLYIVDSPT